MIMAFIALKRDVKLVKVVMVLEPIQMDFSGTFSVHENLLCFDGFDGMTGCKCLQPKKPNMVLFARLLNGSLI